jgi:hypothetical protein
VGPDRIGQLTDPLREAWAARPGAGPEADGPVALGIWWALVERCDAASRTACLGTTDVTFATAGVPRPAAAGWSATPVELRVAGYLIGLDLLGAPAGGGVPGQLPAWAVAP